VPVDYKADSLVPWSSMLEFLRQIAWAYTTVFSSPLSIFRSCSRHKNTNMSQRGEVRSLQVRYIRYTTESKTVIAYNYGIWKIGTCKSKVKLSLWTQWRYMREWRCGSTHLALDGRELSASRTRCFTPGGRGPGTHWIGGWVDLTIDLDALDKRKITWPCWTTFRRMASP
jgi:hypothetical protein